VQRLACESSRQGSSHQITALALVAATLPAELKPACNPPAPVSVLMINGTADQKVPWEGGQRPYGAIVFVPESIQFWRQHNGCKSPVPLEQRPSTRVDIARYGSCQGVSELSL